MTNKIKLPKLAIVVSQTNYDHTYLMEKRAIEHANFLGCPIVEIARVPGSYDMPLIIKSLLQKENIDAIITLGTIIKGETEHDRIIAGQVARKIVDLSLEYDKPVSLGISGPGMTTLQSKARIEKFAVAAVESAVKIWREKDRINETTK
ncbi:MAG: 6,7-dimethyl-8-ribityllumazine synthase [Candidatus Heimdallarchaeota archaeon]|nr:6,7-dimethyl-8-ribityllumazine synthase [Candidatus Heimdallarchaeota archaeon]MDH5645438.1 6,7-dimethyl-8-ribityllumazine synthase [Candidatus Heimdallarchaeota archaeon]